MSAPVRMQLLRDAVYTARNAVADHDRGTSERSNRLASVEQAFIASRMATAMGSEAPADAPSATDLETLRADISIAEPLRKQLEAMVKQREKELQAAERSEKAKISDYLRTTALVPARVELAEALAQVRNAAVKVIAAHDLAEQKFNDRALPLSDATELGGPIGKLLHALQSMDWPSYPYSVRPDWLPVHGQWWADEMPGVREHTAALLDDVKREFGA